MTPIYQLRAFHDHFTPVIHGNRYKDKDNDYSLRYRYQLPVGYKNHSFSCVLLASSNHLNIISISI